MDWHPDTNSAASSHYPTRGRRGRKFVGGANKTAIMRQKHEKFLPRWRKAFEKRFGRKPLESEMRAAIDKGTVFEDIQRWGPNLTLEIKHGEKCRCRLCRRYPINEKAAATMLDEFYANHGETLKQEEAERLEREARITAERTERNKLDAMMAKAKQRSALKRECPIPFAVLQRYKNGDITLAIILQCFPVSADRVSSYLDAFFGS